MSILKNKKIGLSALLAIVVLSLALAAFLPVVAVNGEDVYYTITVETNNTQMGKVIIVGTNPHPSEPNKYLKGSNVTILAVEEKGYDFVRWDWLKQGEERYSESPEMPNEVVSEDRTYVASFAAEQYKIVYPKDDPRLQYPSDQSKPTIHTYGIDTELPVPSTTDGYTFKGWLVESGDTQVEKTGSQVLGKHEFGADIYLYPLFEENLYDVFCEDRTESGELLSDPDNPRKKEYPFATQGKDIPVSDWDSEDPADDAYRGFTQDREQYKTLTYPVMVNTKLNVVTRIYKPNTYTAILDNNAPDATGGLASVQMVYSKDFPAELLTELPTRTGYVCMGYYLDVNNNGECDQDDIQFCQRDPYAVPQSWDVTEFRLTDELFDQFVVDGKITLKAQWEKVPFRLIFNVENSAYADKVNITVTSVDGVDYTNRPIPYDTEVIITIKVDDSCKLIKWNGETLKHTNQHTVSYIVPARDTAFSLTVLPDDPGTPVFTVDYAREWLVPPEGETGIFRLEDRDHNEILSFRVNADGSIVIQNAEQKVSITEYLGKKLYLVRCGDGTEYADSDHQEITLAERPVAVVIDPNTFNVAWEDHKIEIIFKNNEYPIGWEYACSTVYLSETDAGSLLPIWQDQPVFTDLDPGTTYYIYARKKATDSAPHGLWARMCENITSYDSYIREQIGHLNDLMDADIAGENVSQLVENAKQALLDLVEELKKGSASFYSDADKIVKDVERQIEHARDQDRAIAELEKVYKGLVDSGKYSETGLLSLGAIYNEAVRNISAADSDIKVNDYRKNALKEFDLVPISYLTSGDVKIYAENGMDKEYSLDAKAQDDSMESIAPKIYQAINSGSALFPGRATAELINSLKTKDVLGYYSLKLFYPEDVDVHTVAQGPYEIRLTLPEALRDDTGFVVVYYNESTGEITVLEATRVGNELIFVSQSMEDFVILGDHAVNLMWICIGLSVLALMQIIALAVISSRRRNNKKGMRMNGFALPAFALAIRFYPVTAIQAVIALALLVVVLQIALIVLLIKTDVVPRKRREQKDRAPRDASDVAFADAKEAPAEATYKAAEEIEVIEATEETEIAEMPAETEIEPVAETVSKEEAVATEVYEDEIEMSADEDVPLEDAAYEAEDFVDDGEAVESVDEWYGDEDFIEPAPNPAYSLPDDGEAYAEDGEVYEDTNGYSLEYDANGYTLEYDNEPVEYTDEEFDGEGEGFVEYAEDELVDGAAFEAYDEQAEENATEEFSAENVDYGYDVEAADDDSVVYYDYAEAQDVIREDDDGADQ